MSIKQLNKISNIKYNGKYIFSCAKAYGVNGKYCYAIIDNRGLIHQPVIGYYLIDDMLSNIYERTFGKINFKETL